MPSHDTDRGRSAFGLTASGRGWYKRLPGAGVKWITSFGNAPTAAEADRVFAERYGDLVAPPTQNAVTLKYACDAFLAAKEPAVSSHTYKDYKAILQRFTDAVGANRLIAAIGPIDFTAYAASIAAYSLVRRTKIVAVVRSTFNWWIAQQWIDSAHYGPAFVQPSKKQARIDRAKRPRKLFTRAQVRALLGKRPPMMRAAILLGINGGLGPADVSRITVDMIDGDLLRADREKTGATRIVPLWPMTLKALARLRPDESGRLFYSHRGTDLEALNNRGIVRRFGDLCDACKVPRLGFYTLRRTFRTVTDEVPDRRAVEIVMGHVQDDMGSVYVQQVHPDRLRVVTRHVLVWLTSRAADASPDAADGKARTAAGLPARRRSASESSATSRRVSGRESRQT